MKTLIIQDGNIEYEIVYSINLLNHISYYSCTDLKTGEALLVSYYIIQVLRDHLKEMKGKYSK